MTTPISRQQFLFLPLHVKEEILKKVSLSDLMALKTATDTIREDGESFEWKAVNSLTKSNSLWGFIAERMEFAVSGYLPGEAYKDCRSYIKLIITNALDAKSHAPPFSSYKPLSCENIIRLRNETNAYYNVRNLIEIKRSLEDPAAHSELSYYMERHRAYFPAQLELKVRELNDWLQENSEKISATKELHTTLHFLPYIPSMLYQFTNLRQLEFHDLPDLPMELTELVNLRILKLSSNHFFSFPPVILRLTHLELLDLSSNRIRLIPSSIQNLTNLKHLDLSSNPIRQIPPEIGRIDTLKALLLNYTLLQELPSEVLTVPKLFELTLSGTNVMSLCSDKILSSSVEKLSIDDIEMLTPNVSLNQLLRLNLTNIPSEIPDYVWNLPQLRVIAFDVSPLFHSISFPCPIKWKHYEFSYDMTSSTIKKM